MNTSLGYAKKTLTNSNVLLSGGGDKALSEFIGSLNWDSTNKKLQYKSASSTNFTDLITFGSNAFTNYSGYNIAFLNNAGTTVDTFKALTSPSKTLKAGANVQMTAASNVITISATDTWRGILNNLTSDSTTNSLSAALGKALANGSARDDTKLFAFNFGGTGSTTKIKININSTIKFMLSFVVTIYLGYRSTKVMVSGYNYGNNYWSSPKAVIIGDTSGTTVKTYFGYDGVNLLWVGFDGGSYTGICITDVCNGYQLISSFSDLFTISNVSLFGGTTQSTITPVNPYIDTWNANALGVAGYVAAPTASNANMVWKCDASGNPAWRADANSDTNVTQSASDTSNWRKVLLHYTSDSAHNAAVTAGTSQVYAAVGVSVLPSTGTLRATVLDGSTIKGTSIYLNETALSTAATHAHGDYVTAIGTSGNTLTWSKGGTAQTAITVPYATTADLASLMWVDYCRGDSSADNSGEWSRIKNTISADGRVTGRAKFYTVYKDGGPTNYGEVLEICSRNSNHWQPQLWFESGKGGHMYYRNKSNNNDTWGDWLTILDSGNYTSYTVKKDGTGASGTWGISITGNAATATSANTINVTLNTSSNAAYPIIWGSPNNTTTLLSSLYKSYDKFTFNPKTFLLVVSGNATVGSLTSGSNIIMNNGYFYMRCPIATNADTGIQTADNRIYAKIGTNGETYGMRFYSQYNPTTTFTSYNTYFYAGYGTLGYTQVAAGTLGYQILTLGGGTKITAANSCAGILRLYTTQPADNTATVRYGQIYPVNLTGNRNYYLPNNSGTIALVTDITNSYWADVKVSNTSSNDTTPRFLRIGLGTAVNNSYSLTASGNCSAANYYTTSDRNKKQDITILSNHIRKFQLKDSGKYAYGVIAQEVEEMFRDGEEGNMTVNYNSVLSYYVGSLENSVAGLLDAKRQLENKIAQLERELNELKSKYYGNNSN